jgi:hypothetical protein
LAIGVTWLPALALRIIGLGSIGARQISIVL